MKRLVAVVVALVGVLLLASIGQLHHDSFATEYEFHGWDRAILISPAEGRPRISQSPPSAEAVLATFLSPFNPRRVLSEEALSRIRSLQEVESVFPFVEYSHMTDETGTPIFLTVADPGFFEAFRLGDGRELSEKIAIASRDAEKAGAMVQYYKKSSLTFRRSKIQGASMTAESQLDAVVPTQQAVSERTFLPRPLIADRFLQLYASPVWMDSPKRRAGLYIPEMNIVVKTHRNVDIVATMQEIQEIVDSAPSSLVFKGLHARTRLLTDVSYFDFTQRALIVAGRWIQVTAFSVGAVIATLLIWTQFRQLVAELALRRGFGQSAFSSAFFALRSDFQRLCTGLLVAILLGWLWFAIQGHLSASLTSSLSLSLGVFAGAGVSLMFATAVAARSPAALLRRIFD